jgi:hypothetical protein
MMGTIMTQIQMRDIETGDIVDRSTDEMTNETMASEAMHQFLYAVDNRLIELMPGSVHTDIKVHVDHPMGETRLTYGYIVDGQIESVIVFTVSGAYKGKLCFDTGYSTMPSSQGKGYVSIALKKCLDELTNGLKRNGIDEFYIEMKVDKGNLPSNIIASRISTEREAEEGINRYFKHVVS